MRNVENLVRLADVIENGILADKDIGFNMKFWNEIANGMENPDLSGHDCGTTCCIGGTAKALWPGDDINKILGLTNDESFQLFYPQNIDDDWNVITPEIAARKLRAVAEGSSPEWTEEDLAQ